MKNEKLYTEFDLRNAYLGGIICSLGYKDLDMLFKFGFWVKQYKTHLRNKED